MKLKVGDKVLVIAGKDKGKTGMITKTLKKDNKVVVEKINVVKKHMKPKGNDQKGGIIELDAPIHASNVMLVDPKTNKPTRKRPEVVKKEKSIKEKTTKEKVVKEKVVKEEKVAKKTTKKTK